MSLFRTSLLKRSSCSWILAALSLAAVPAEAQTPQWIRQFGTESPDRAYGVAVRGNAVYAAGETSNGSFPGYTNAGGLDAFVSQFDSAGQAVWTRQFGTASHDTALGVAADASGVYVVGRTGGALPGQTSLGDTDAFARKYDMAGNEVWTRQFGSNNTEEAYGAAVNETGVYVAGRTAGALPGQTSGSLGQDDGFVRKYDPSGNELWTRQFGTSSGDRVYGVAADASGIYVTGSTGGPLVTGAAGTDGFVRKYDNDGNVVWTRQIASTGTGNDIAYAVGAGDSGVYVTGDTTGTFAAQTRAGGLYDGWARKYDLDGTEQWTSQFGTSGDDHGYGIGVGSESVYVTGYSNGALLVQKYAVGGGDTGTLRLGSINNFGRAVAADGSGAYVAGETNGTQLGETTPIRDQDAFVLKIPTPPVVSGVSDAFTGQPGVSPTTWIAIYGSNLSGTTRTWDGAIQGTQLPHSLDDVSVQINGRPATIYFISPGQVNVIPPLDDRTGDFQLTLTNTFGTSQSFTVHKSEYLPAFYAPFGNAQGLGVTAVALDGTLVGKVGLDPRVTREARPGEVIQFFATGFGGTIPPTPSDVLFAIPPEVAIRPRITIGGQEAAIAGNGNLVGPALFQFNLTIPDLADGDHVIRAEVGGAQSLDSVFLSVKR